MFLITVIFSSVINSANSKYSWLFTNDNKSLTVVKSFAESNASTSRIIFCRTCFSLCQSINDVSSSLNMSGAMLSAYWYKSSCLFAKKSKLKIVSIIWFTPSASNVEASKFPPSNINALIIFAACASTNTSKISAILKISCFNPLIPLGPRFAKNNISSGRIVLAISRPATAAKSNNVSSVNLLITLCARTKTSSQIKLSTFRFSIKVSKSFKLFSSITPDSNKYATSSIMSAITAPSLARLILAALIWSLVKFNSSIELTCSNPKSSKKSFLALIRFKLNKFSIAVVTNEISLQLICASLSKYKSITPKSKIICTLSKIVWTSASKSLAVNASSNTNKSLNSPNASSGKNLLRAGSSNTSITWSDNKASTAYNNSFALWVVRSDI